MFECGEGSAGRRRLRGRRAEVREGPFAGAAVVVAADANTPKPSFSGAADAAGAANVSNAPNAAAGRGRRGASVEHIEQTSVGGRGRGRRGRHRELRRRRAGTASCATAPSPFPSPGVGPLTPCLLSTNSLASYFFRMNRSTTGESELIGFAPLGRFASQYAFARRLPMRSSFTTWSSVHRSSAVDRTNEMCTPRPRWAPEQLVQMKMPRLTLAHRGRRIGQSAHTRFSGRFRHRVRRF